MFLCVTSRLFFSNRKIKKGERETQAVFTGEQAVTPRKETGFRKWGGIPTGLTQNVGDFLKSEEIEGILGNSDFVYLLNQNAKDQSILADKLGLSEKQLMHVTNSEPGSGLILFDNVVIPFVDRYPTDTKTFRIMNTKLEENAKEGEK